VDKNIENPPTLMVTNCFNNHQ